MSPRQVEQTGYGRRERLIFLISGFLALSGLSDANSHEGISFALDVHPIFDDNYYYSLDVTLHYSGTSQIVVYNSELPWADPENMDVKPVLGASCKGEVRQLIGVGGVPGETTLRPGSALSGVLSLSSFENLKDLAKSCPVELQWTYTLKDRDGNHFGQMNGKLELSK